MHVFCFVASAIAPDNMKNTAARYPGVDLVDRFQLALVAAASAEALSRYNGAS